MKKYNFKRIWAAQGDSIRFMNDDYKLDSDIKAQPICENISVDSMDKIVASIYHIHSHNLVLQYIRYRDEKECPRQSIVLFGNEEQIGEVEKIVLENIKNLN